MGFRDLIEWNKAAMCKHIWNIANEKESLWLQWINHVYLQGEDIWGHRAPLASSWQWKKIMEIKNEVKQNHLSLITTPYTIGKGYKAFVGEKQPIYWNTQVWSKWSVPKHRIIFWLAMNNRMQTRERIMRFRNIPD